MILSPDYYSQLDKLGRCGVTAACIGLETMPTEEWGPIGMIKPFGWHTVWNDDLIEDNYLYNGCHLIAYQLTGENANEQNLIRVTRYLKKEGMLPLENEVAAFIRRTGKRDLYRSTPFFVGDDLVARGVLIEAVSIEDDGTEVHLCAFAYNVQPGINIDYANGDGTRSLMKVPAPDTILEGYIGKKKSKVFHLPICLNLPGERNQILFENHEEALAA